MKACVDYFVIFVAAISLAGCAKRAEFSDPRVQELIRCANQSERAQHGFSPIESHGELFLHTKSRRGDLEIEIVTAKCRRMIAFEMTTMGPRWLAELESNYGPRKFPSPDGEYREEITLAYQRMADVYVGGGGTEALWINYRGEDRRLILPHGKITLEDVRPILREWRQPLPQ